MAVIDDVFYLDARVTCKFEMLWVVSIESSEIMGTYNTPDIIPNDSRSSLSHKIMIVSRTSLYRMFSVFIRHFRNNQ